MTSEARINGMVDYDEISFSQVGDGRREITIGSDGCQYYNPETEDILTCGGVDDQMLPGNGTIEPELLDIINAAADECGERPVPATGWEAA